MKLLSRWFRHASTTPSWIEPAALAMRLEPDDAPLILDVRVLTNSPVRSGISDRQRTCRCRIAAHLPELVRENRPVVVVCKTDRRSSVAAQQLREAGVLDVSVLRGGMEQWRVLGLPAN